MDKRTNEWSAVSAFMGEPGVPAEDSGPLYQPDPRCHVCSAADKDLPNGSAVRTLVDDLLCMPRGYAAIMRLIAPLMELWPEEDRISRYGLRRHAASHLGWEREGIRRIADRRAERDGRLDDAAGRMLSSAVVLEAIQQRGFDALISGEITPSVRDILAASAALRELERETEGTTSIASAYADLDVVIQAIREAVPVEYHNAILKYLEAREARFSASPASDPHWDEIVSEMGEQALASASAPIRT